MIMKREETDKIISDLRNEVKDLKEASILKESYYQSGWAADDRLQAALYQVREKEKVQASMQKEIDLLKQEIQRLELLRTEQYHEQEKLQQENEKLKEEEKAAIFEGKRVKYFHEKNGKEFKSRYPEHSLEYLKNPKLSDNNIFRLND